MSAPPLLNPYNSHFIPLLYCTRTLLQTHCWSLVKPYSVRVIKCLSGMRPFSVNKCFQDSFTGILCYKIERTEKRGNPTPEHFGADSHIGTKKTQATLRVLSQQKAHASHLNVKMSTPTITDGNFQYICVRLEI